ncbi:hypothetical protein [Phenylobacterium aquaticum]|uniref:hypothetical protein n=2 Tax=Phenylobacterium aquaticum TaxID=1763816 RepID=UPI0026F33A3B|nr:hypothetical protein [Phenylobacterium aquaticum]
MGLLVLGAARLLLGPAFVDRDFNRAHAEQFLGKHRGELDHLVQLVENCQPTDNLEASPDKYAQPVRCSNGPQSGVQDIRDALNKLHLVAAFSTPSDTPKDAPTADDDPTVSIVTAQVGIMVSGHVTQLNYHQKAREPAEYIDAGPDGRVYSEERALTPPPHHWFWEQTN